MARKSKRARAKYLRRDYRKGGRVRLQDGGYGDTPIQDLPTTGEKIKRVAGVAGRALFDPVGAGVSVAQRQGIGSGENWNRWTGGGGDQAEWEDVSGNIGGQPPTDALRNEDSTSIFQRGADRRQQRREDRAERRGDRDQTRQTTDPYIGASDEFKNRRERDLRTKANIDAKMDAPDFSGFESKGVVGDPSRQGQGPTSAQMAAMKMNQAVDESGLNYEAQLEANAERRAIQQFRDTGEWPSDEDYYYKDSATQARPSQQQAQQKTKEQIDKEMAENDMKAGEEDLFNAYDQSQAYATQPSPYMVDGKPRGKGPWHRPSPLTGKDPLDPKGHMSTAELEREYRILRAGKSAEDTAQGKLPAGARIPPAQMLDSSIKGKVFEVGETTKAQAQKVAAIKAEEITDAAVKTGTLPIGTDVKTYNAFLNDFAPEVQDVIGSLSPESQARVVELNKLTGPAQAANIIWKDVEASKAKDVTGTISAGAFVPEVKGIGGQVSPTADAELHQRTALTTTADQEVAAEIINDLSYEAATRRVVTGVDAKGGAAAMVAETTDLPPDIVAAVVEDPASVEAQIDNTDISIQAAVAAMPPEALVSAQMETLLGGLEDGEIPMWARPAVDAVNSRMMARGLDVSSVGRDALYNAIITTAFPMAQSNAQALQARATQNLSNEQQATLTAAQQQQELRIQNLANRQTAASQTAQMSQQMKVQRGQFRQEAILQSAAQQQQTRTQNLQNLQQAAVVRSQNQQQINSQELGIESQVDLAELQILDNVERENMTAEQQFRLVEYQTAADFMAKNAAFTQDMRKANMTSEQQTRLANLTSLNQNQSENLSAKQQTELANLNKRMQVNLTSAELANQMGVAQLNADQQKAVVNAQTVANLNMAQFNYDQQKELTNSKFMQTMTLTDFNQRQQAAMQDATALASLDLATVDQRTKIAVQHAQAFLSLDMANLNNEQQSAVLNAQMEQQRLLSNQSSMNAAKQFNATSENQRDQFMIGLGANMEQFNVAQQNTMEQFNVTQTNAAEARRTARDADTARLEAQLVTQVNQFNAQVDYNREQWNKTNAQAVEQANVTWRRQANTADTAAANAVSMQNAQNTFALSVESQKFLWQELRDQADYIFRAADNEENRKTQLYAQSLANEGNLSDNWSTIITSVSRLVDSLFPQEGSTKIFMN